MFILVTTNIFILNTRGLYYVKGNDMFFNEKYISSPNMLIKVLRHEGWHTAQDCMAGTLDNTFTAIIFIPTKFLIGLKMVQKEHIHPQHLHMNRKQCLQHSLIP